VDVCLMVDFKTVWPYLREAEAMSEMLEDRRRLARVSAYMSGHHLATGSHTFSYSHTISRATIEGLKIRARR